MDFKSDERLEHNSQMFRKFAGELWEDYFFFKNRDGMHREFIDFGGMKLQLNVPKSDLSWNISLHQAFRAEGDLDSSISPSYSISIFDDRYRQRQAQVTWPNNWHFPLGVIESKLTHPLRVAVDRHTQTLSVFDPTLREVLIWTPSLETMPYWAAATPFRLQLSWIANQQGWEFTHTAAVEYPGRVILLGGASGSGKSTLAMAATARGAKIVADDYLLVHGSLVCGVYDRVKMHENSLRFIDSAMSIALNTYGVNEKKVFKIPESIGLLGWHQSKCIVIPRVSDQNRLSLISAGSAMRAIAPYSISGILGGNELSIKRISELTSYVSCFELHSVPGSRGVDFAVDVIKNLEL